MDSTVVYSYKVIQADQLRLCRFVGDGDILSASLEPFSASHDLRPPYVAFLTLGTRKTQLQMKAGLFRLDDITFQYSARFDLLYRL